MLIIPAVDILENRVVRLTRGDYGEVSDYPLRPVEVFRAWAAAGARRVHLVFLGAARDGLRSRSEDPVLLDILAEKKRLGITLQVGGGVRTSEEAVRLFQWGVDYIIMGTAAVLDIIRLGEEKKRVGYRGALLDFVREVNMPFSSIIQELVRLDLSGRVIVGLDEKSGSVAVSGWEVTLPPAPEALAVDFAEIGFRHCVYTATGRDGTLSGPDTEAIARVARAAPGMSFIAAGGIGTAADVGRLAGLALPNLEGVIVGKALYEGRIDLAGLIRETGEA